MNVKEAIDNRKSIRKYQNKPIPEEIIREILDAARLAPSAHNIQSHKYCIVQDPEEKARLKEVDAFRQEYVYNAPAIIICCANPKEYSDSGDKYALIDLSIAASFLILRATDLGIGSVFVGLINSEKIRQVLGIPKEYIIPFVIPLGYPAENPDARLKKSINEIVF